MPESRIITDEETLTPEELAQFMADDNDEPSEEEMARSNEIAARYEADQDLD